MILALLAIGLMVAGSAQAGASTKKHKTVAAKTKKKSSGESNLSTDVSFDDSVLRGEYQAPEEALAKVENEKGFGDLIGVRKHFKDRLAEAAEQE
jgi:basic membrane lipoprotein Med (substrate-binding protein (PBP1-ABC) superfamily)